MITNEGWNDNADAIKYAYISWSEMTEEQKEAEVDKLGTAYDDWCNSLAKIGVIGIYDEDSEKELDKITGCTEHKEIGSSSDGKYKICERCCHGITPQDGEEVYITIYGDRYHKSRTCSGLKRTIREIMLSQVGNRAPCSKCGGKEK